MNKWRITYPDGTTEDIEGYDIRVYNGVLSIDQGHSSYNRQTRSWPLTSIRSWEKL